MTLISMQIGVKDEAGFSQAFLRVLVEAYEEVVVTWWQVRRVPLKCNKLWQSPN